MVPPMNTVIDRVLAALNARNLEALVARYDPMFETYPALHLEPLGRWAVGSFVVQKERVRQNSQAPRQRQVRSVTFAQLASADAEESKERRMSLDELDGVAVAPDIHKVIFENDQVRVLETTITAGEITPLHTHLTPTLMYVLSGSHFIRRDEHGATMLDTRANPDFVLPKVLYSESTPKHTLENTGADDLVVIGVELKNSLVE